MASNSSKLSAPEIYEIQQYEKVVTFAESIASRIHPGIKMPTEVKVAPLEGNNLEPGEILSSPILEKSTWTSNQQNSHHSPGEVSSSRPGMEKSSPAPRATEGALPKLHLKEEDVIINYNLDYYQILGLEDLEHSRITEEVVHKTFNALNMLHYPDGELGSLKWVGKHPQFKVSAYQFWNRIVNAFQVLSDKKLRQEYDAGRASWLQDSASPATGRYGNPSPTSDRLKKEPRSERRTSDCYRPRRDLGSEPSNSNRHRGSERLSIITKSPSTTYTQLRNDDRRLTHDTGSRTLADREPSESLEGELDINYSHDYYADLGVDGGIFTRMDSLNRAFQFKAVSCMPGSSQWNKTTAAESRKEYQERWERIKKAHRILTNSTLREKYDKEREKRGLFDPIGGRLGGGSWDRHKGKDSSANSNNILQGPPKATSLRTAPGDSHRATSQTGPSGVSRDALVGPARFAVPGNAPRGPRGTFNAPIGPRPTPFPLLVARVPNNNIPSPKFDDLHKENHIISSPVAIARSAEPLGALSVKRKRGELGDVRLVATRGNDGKRNMNNIGEDKHGGASVKPKKIKREEWEESEIGRLKHDDSW